MISSRSPLVRIAILAAFTLSSAAALTSSTFCRADEPKVKPIRALLVLGGCCHDYETQKALLSKGISDRAHVEVTIAHDSDKTTRHLNPIYELATWADGFDVIIHDECSSDVKDLAVIDRILEPHRKGLPAVILHCGMHSYRSEGYPKSITSWFEFTGLQSTGHGPQAPIDIKVIPQSSPIAEGQPNWTTINEELYNNSEGKLLDTAQPIAKGRQKFIDKNGNESSTECVVVWTNEYRQSTKVFATTLGHNNDTVADDRYLDLVTRGLLWSCGKLNSDYLKK